MSAPAAATPTPARPARWRSVVAGCLVVLAALLAPLSLTAVWVRDRILRTDGYERTVAPLAEDPVVTDALAARIVDELFAVAEVEDRVTDVLPGPVEALGPTFTASLRRLAIDQTERLLASARFARLWEQANRVAHAQVVAMFAGEVGALSQDEGAVVLDLGVVAEEVRRRLVDAGVGVLRRVTIPEGAIEVTLFESDLVPRLQTLFRVLDDLAVALPVLFVVCVVGAIAIAPRRRRVVVVIGLAVAGATALVPVALDVGRRETLAVASSSGLDGDATKAVYDTLVEALREWAWLTIAVALLTAAVAAVTTPRWVDALLGRVWTSTRGEARVAAWIRAHRAPSMVAVVAAAVLLLVVWPTPTLLVAAVVALAAGVGVAVIAALARRATDRGLGSPPARSGVSLERSDDP